MLLQRINTGLKCYIRKHSAWIKPDGYNTGINIYNCITKTKVPFIVQNENFVSWYTCGPTVYDSSHIGHASCYVKLDIIQRILRQYFSLNVVTVMNITDVDDKIIMKSNDFNCPIVDITQKYEQEFWDDLKKLNVLKPNIIVRVTEQMPIIKSFIRKLLDSNQSYRASDGSVYFDTSKASNYGKLQNVIVSSEESAFKKSKEDFALWKGAKLDEPYWEADWGEGRPGWHIECSAMASAVFGNSVDVHAGGIDLKFPHHENEEAQSCAFHKTNQWVNYWVHTGHLHVVGQEKMSKSLKNTIFISDLLRTYDSDVFRMACLMSHYRANMEFSDEVMKTAETNLNKIKAFLHNCSLHIKQQSQCGELDKNAVLELIISTNDLINCASKDDFNTAKIIKSILEFVDKINKMLHETKIDQEESYNLSNSAIMVVVSNFIDSHLNKMGFSFKETVDLNEGMVDNVMNVFTTYRSEVRKEALKNKDKHLLHLCDIARDNLKSYGFILQDQGKSSTWRK